MTQKEKELLSKDLCARLPYGVIVHRTYIWGEKIKEDDGELEIFDMDPFLNESIEKLNEQGCTIKPYLRPLESQTDEEMEERSECVGDVMRMDYYYAHHLDCHQLIKRGLALEAPEGMYK